jgi:hypothetical protein
MLRGRLSIVEWRVPRARATVKFVGAGLFLLAGGLLSLGDRLAIWLALAAAAALVISAVRDVVAPVRIAADHDGVTVVVGFNGRRRLPWSQVERVRVDARQRLGVTSELVEIDAGDNLYLYSERELGTPVHEVVEALTRLHHPG